MIFGKRKKEENKIVEAKEEEKEEVKEEKPKKVEVPLFVKLDNYQQITATISELKELLSFIKDYYNSLAEIERMKSESFESIKQTFIKIEEKIEELEKRFVLPSLPSVQPEERHDEEFEKSLSDLRERIEKLKQEISTL